MPVSQMADILAVLIFAVIILFTPPSGAFFVITWLGASFVYSITDWPKGLRK